MSNDKKIIHSWEKNSQPWIKAIREQQIESRTLITDQAIVNTIESVSPSTLLDIGCGEGWLARECIKQGIEVLGIDAIANLIKTARSLGGGQFQVMTYEDMADHCFTQKYDAAVGNFSLLGKESVEHIFQTLPSILNRKGCFIIQTLHPCMHMEDVYIDGWRDGSWEGFGEAFTNPAPWYFRTIASWLALFEKNGFKQIQIKEPIHPKHAKPASLIIIGKQLS